MDLPGGKRHVHETAWACALREAAEELYTDAAALPLWPQFMVNCGRGVVEHFPRGIEVGDVVRMKPEDSVGGASLWRDKVHLVASVGEGVRAASGGGGGGSGGATGPRHASETVDAGVASLGAMLDSVGL